MSLDRFQAARNVALADFLHGAHLTRAARVLHPFHDASTPRAGDTLAAVWSAARAQQIELPDPPARPTPRDEAVFLACAYRVSIEEHSDRQQTDGDASRVQVPGWDPARHGRVPQLVRARRAYAGLGRVFVHGSYADLAFTPYSDLDILLLLSRDDVASVAALLRARKRVIASLRPLRAFDPLQHHGHFVLTELDLPSYPDGMFPEVIWRTCVSLDDAGATLRIATRKNADDSARRFRVLARRLLDTDLNRGKTSAFRLKSDLSVFMLLPALWLQARGRAVSKVESFALAYAKLSETATATLKHAARIRERWTYREPRLNRWLRRLWFNALLPAIVDSVRSAPPARAVAELIDDAFLTNMRAAVEEMLRTHDEGDVSRATESETPGKDLGADRSGTRDAVA